MRNNERRSVFHHIGEGLLQFALGLRVYAGSRVIEDKYRRVTENGASNSETLSLATGQFDSAFTYDGVVSVLQAHDEVVQLRDFGCFAYLLFARCLHAVGDVVSKCSGENKHILQDDPDVSPRRPQTRKDSRVTSRTSSPSTVTLPEVTS